MRQARASYLQWLFGLGVTLSACSNEPGSAGKTEPSPAACADCRSLVDDDGLVPAAVASDGTSAFVIKTMTSEVLRVTLADGKSALFSDAVPSATSLLLRPQALWVVDYQAELHSLWSLDLQSGEGQKLRDLPGLSGIGLGPDGAVVALREAGKLRVVSLADDGSDANELWQSAVAGTYFADFAAGVAGVAWIVASSTASSLYFEAAGESQPTSAGELPAATGGLAVSDSGVALLGVEAGVTSLYTLGQGKLAKQGSLPEPALGIRPLGASFLVSAASRHTLWKASPAGQLVASKELTGELNIAASADSERVFLPLVDALASFPRTGDWR